MTLTLTVQDWDQPRRTLDLPDDCYRPIQVTNRGIAVQPRQLSAPVPTLTPLVPVSGEMHFSRVPRQRWIERLQLMKAGGITHVAAYVIWIHHAPQPGPPDFTDNRDVDAFIAACVEVGLDVVLRIGPWCHGEVRNGGFPDWVQQADVSHRTNDPRYLDLVADWYGALAVQVRHWCVPGGPIAAIQVDNELTNQPQHLATLKQMAQQAGMRAPLWTATAWGRAQLPLPDLMPLFGGYGDGFWVPSATDWEPGFQAHYRFSRDWDDSAIGADLRTEDPGAVAMTEPGRQFPPVTCELGGGMATAYHRRADPTAADIATIALTKIGNGSAWQGYYMYTGGTNPGLDLQESHATGYPNDMPPLTYDFHAPVGESGLLAPSHAALRRQHAFLTAFGHRLHDWPSSLPDGHSHAADDRTPRWAFRGSDSSGVAVIAWHQPHYAPLAATEPVQFQVTSACGSTTFPSAPISIPPGTLGLWPVGLAGLDWATASLLTQLPASDGVGRVADVERAADGDAASPCLVLLAHAGIDPEVVVEGERVPIVPSLTPTQLADQSLLLLPPEVADHVWVREGPQRQLYLSESTLRWSEVGPITVTGEHADVRVYSHRSGGFVPVPSTAVGPGPRAQEVTPSLIRSAQPVPAGYGDRRGHHSAPTAEVMDELAAVFEVPLPDWALEDAAQTFLVIDWAGDIAQLRVAGQIVRDRYWDGSQWWINLADAGIDSESVALHLLPLSEQSAIRLPPVTANRRSGAGDLLALDRVQLVRRGVWTLTD